ncbi:LysR family transcriptional regulator [Falsirhodobacter sp. 20TX0035]|uniref:LysR family transcriptional regulator n=1 Tax=Falsirhodobacter sp. 20TX0035 TaxID=3022019 RepID=UPI002330DCE9|nr:LysR family transcriptional regulator [Falsirhodobacter sp. 20TX0035]MDB6454944.1 LysR family transcriptional regulator [Falsirhodobacter sp. 20TX0035]
MYTLKQIEAFDVSATLGSFTDASRKLSLTQSTIAKRIMELEAAVGTPLFIRLGKSLRLTSAGERLLPAAREMMRLNERMVQTMTTASHLEGHVRIGATDLVGLTWLPALIQAVRLRYPKVRVMPEIDGGVRLYERLTRNELDIVIMPGPFASPEVDAVPLGCIRNAWMASPAFDLPEGTLTPQQVSALPVIGQPDKSALTVLYRKWFAEHGFVLNNVLSCNSLGMVAKLTTYGLGVSYLPLNHFAPQIAEGALRVVDVAPELPLVTYYSLMHHEASPLAEVVLPIMKQVNDFEADLMELPDDTSSMGSKSARNVSSAG